MADFFDALGHAPTWLTTMLMLLAGGWAGSGFVTPWTRRCNRDHDEAELEGE